MKIITPLDPLKTLQKVIISCELLYGPYTVQIINNSSRVARQNYCVWRVQALIGFNILVLSKQKLDFHKEREQNRTEGKCTVTGGKGLYYTTLIFNDKTFLFS